MIPQEQNDRLLELAGECRHVWIEAEHGYRFVCRKCGRDWLCDDPDEPEPPTVGDDIDMTLGEMVRLVKKLWAYSQVVFRSSPNMDEYGASVLYPGRVDSCVFDGANGYGPSPEAALTAAILAAVDGAK